MRLLLPLSVVLVICGLPCSYATIGPTRSDTGWNVRPRKQAKRVNTDQSYPTDSMSSFLNAEVQAFDRNKLNDWSGKSHMNKILTRESRNSFIGTSSVAWAPNKCLISSNLFLSSPCICYRSSPVACHWRISLVVWLETRACSLDSSW